VSSGGNRWPSDQSVEEDTAEMNTINTARKRERLERSLESNFSVTRVKEKSTGRTFCPSMT